MCVSLIRYYFNKSRLLTLLSRRSSTLLPRERPQTWNFPPRWRSWASRIWTAAPPARLPDPPAPRQVQPRRPLPGRQAGVPKPLPPRPAPKAHQVQSWEMILSVRGAWISPSCPLRRPHFIGTRGNREMPPRYDMFLEQRVQAGQVPPLVLDRVAFCISKFPETALLFGSWGCVALQSPNLTSPLLHGNAMDV